MSLRKGDTGAVGRAGPGQGGPGVVGLARSWGFILIALRILSGEVTSNCQKLSEAAL